MKVLDHEKYFWSKVVPTGFCWEWQGTISVYGYGAIKQNNVRKVAHRVAYEYLVGTIPEGLVLDHLCRNRRCVNPDHLEPVSIAENTLRGYGMGAEHSRRTHCPKCGGDDWIPRSDGGRRCRPCSAKASLIRNKRYRERKKRAALVDK